MRFLKHDAHCQFGSPLLLSWNSVRQCATSPHCSMALGTAWQRQQTSTAAKASTCSNKSRGTLGATQLNSALASYSTLQRVCGSASCRSQRVLAKPRAEQKCWGTGAMKNTVWHQRVHTWWCAGQPTHNHDARARQPNMMQQAPAWLHGRFYCEQRARQPTRTHTRARANAEQPTRNHHAHARASTP